MQIKTDTIAAIATPLGKGGIGIIRISGSRAKEILQQLFRPLGSSGFAPRYLVLGDIIDPEGKQLLDQALAVYMPAPHSYTAEDVAELQCHGGLRLLENILALVLRQGARLAEPGEFTLRAFLNGRIDLAQAEAVCDLIEAKTPKSAAIASRQLSGALSARLLEIEQGLLHILALITVGVDFPDDVDAPENSELLALLAIEQQSISSLLEKADLGLSYREGIKTALLGSVNAGKSSLMNALLSRERAIVTAQPGTTRDLIEEMLDINGIPLLLSDTAGLRQAEGLDDAEQLGISRSLAAAEQAQLLLLVIDASRPADSEALALLAEKGDQQKIIILNKTDIAPQQNLEAYQQMMPQGVPVCRVSAKTGAGLAELRQAIAIAAGDNLDSEAGSPLINNLRHQQALSEAAEHIQSAEQALLAGISSDLAGIDIENACFALGKITGSSVSDQVLEEIFSRFCLGK
jgi:tRNA modification GTPase